MENSDTIVLGKNNTKNKKIWKKVLLISTIILLTGGLLYVGYNFFFNKQDQKIYTNFLVKSIETKDKRIRGIDKKSTFIIETDKEVNTESVRRSIYIEPSIDYDVKEVNKKKYEIIPKNSLSDNEVYVLEQVKNEKPVYKWAFETEKKLSITSFEPSSYSNPISRRTSTIEPDEAITIMFSMDDVEDINKYVTISPSIKGNWVKHNSIWVFEHTEKFKEATNYTLTVSKKLKAGNYKLEKDYTAILYCQKSITNNDNDIYFQLEHETIDKINTFSTDEAPKAVIRLYDDEINSSMQINVNTTVYKFKNSNDFKESATTGNIDLSKLSKLNTTKLPLEDGIITLDRTLSVGYYIMRFNYKNKTINQLIQVTDTKAFVINTETDTLVWTVKNAKTASGIQVEFNGKTETTNKDGIAIFKNITNNDDNETYITINTKSKTPTYVLAKNYEKDSFPNAYIYTDRPMYKPTDTINIWGYIPLNEFKDKVEGTFIIKYSNKSKKVKLNKTGTFNTSIRINNVSNDDMQISLYYNDTYLTSRSVEIYDYIKPTYTYEIDLKDDTYYAGETVSFDVTVNKKIIFVKGSSHNLFKVNHITGLTAKNKQVYVVFDNKRYTSKTDSDGIAHFNIKTKFKKDDGLADIYDIDVKTGNSEDLYEGIQASKSITVYYYNVDFETEISNKKLTIEANKIDLSKLNEEDNKEAVYNYSLLRGEKYNTTATVKIYKQTSKKYIYNSYYDDYEGKMIDEYRWDDETELVDTKKVTLKDGKGELDLSAYRGYKEDDKIVNYYVETIVKDTSGRERKETNYIYFFSNYDYDTYHPVLENYYLNITNYKKYNIDDTVRFEIQDKDGIIKNNKGKLLIVFFKEGLVDTKIVTNNDFSFKFKDDYFPGLYITGAYLINGKIYETTGSSYTGDIFLDTTKATYLDYNEVAKKTNIKINTNKEIYSPGEEVELKVIVTDNNNKRLKTDLNISVVDEAIFEIKEDDTSILETIYSNRYFKSYQMSTDRIYRLGGGGMGNVSGGVPRSNFKDMVYFKSLTTDNSGEAIVKFKLPDNITKYRITIHSASANEEIGVNTKSITSTKDFFVESAIPTNVKYTDDLVINAISHGINLKDKTKFTFEIDGKKLTATAKVDSYATVNFSKLSLGTHKMTITATNGKYTDVLIQNIKISVSSQEVKVKTTQDISEKLSIKPTKNPITLEIYDKSLDTYLKYIEQLESIYSSRIDTIIANNEAYRFYKKYYSNEVDIPNIDLSEYNYNDLVRKNLNTKNTNILLSAVINKLAKSYVGSLDFEQVLTNKKTTYTNYYAAYLGLSADNKTILSNLDVLRKKDKKRGALENIILSTSYAYLGDYNSSIEMYKELKVKIDNNKVFIKDKAITNDDTIGMLAILTSMIDKNTSNRLIDLLINKKSTSMYLNFAIISFLDNNTESIENEKNVTISYGKTTKRISINGFHVEKIDLDNKNLENIKFSKYSKDLKISYYYTTSIDEIDNKQIKKDVEVRMNTKLKKDNSTNLSVKYSNKANYDGYEVRVTIPNGLAIDKENLKLPDYVYINNSKREYISFYVYGKKSINLTIPVTAINEGSYVFEPVVIYNNGTYHISSKLNIKISK